MMKIQQGTQTGIDPRSELPSPQSTGGATLALMLQRQSV